MPVRNIDGVIMRSINDVHKDTGISLTNIRKYKDMGLVSAVSTQQETLSYLWFDDTAVLRLKLIKMYREMDVPLKEIQDIFENPNIDVNSLLDNLICKLRKRRDQIDRQIEFCETSKTFGLKGFSLIAASNGGIDTYMQQLKGVMQRIMTSVDEKAIEKMVQNSLIPKLEQLTELVAYAPTTENAQQYIEALLADLCQLFFCFWPDEDTNSQISALGERILVIVTLVYMNLGKGDFSNLFKRFAGEQAIVFISKSAIYCGLKAVARLFRILQDEYYQYSTDSDKKKYIRHLLHIFWGWFQKHAFVQPIQIDEDEGIQELIDILEEMMEIKPDEIQDPSNTDNLYEEIVQAWEKLPL